jgi:carbon monoxide dehydrogenase subunit G
VKIQGQYVFDGTRQEVWDLLLDPEVLRRAVPGVQSWEEVGPHEYRATLKIGVAAVSGTYSGTVAAGDLRPPEHMVLRMDGSGKQGFIKGQGTVDLSEQGQQTLMVYAGDLQVGGALAGAAQRVLPGVAKWFIDQGLKSLAGQLPARRQPPGS